VQGIRVLARSDGVFGEHLSPLAAVALTVFGYATASQIDLWLDVTWVLLGQLLFYAIVILAIAVLRPAANNCYA
jgi:hypothetical protein